MNILQDLKASFSKENVKQEVKKPAYHLFMRVNDKEFECDTNHVAVAIADFKPDYVKAPVTVKITKDGRTLIKMFYAKDARRLFSNPLTREMFVKNLPF